MNSRDWTTSAAKYGAAFVLGAASLGGLVWSLNRRPPATVHIAPVASPPAQRALPPLPEQSPPPTAKSERAPVPDPPPSPLARLPHAAEQATPSTLAPDSPRADPAATAASHRINLNTATQAELELLPGIGPALAKRILDFRAAQGKFASVEQLDNVKGIGPKILEKLRPLVSVE